MAWEFSSLTSSSTFINPYFSLSKNEFNIGVTHPTPPSDNTTSVGGLNPNCVVEDQCFSPAATTWLRPPSPPPFVNDSPMMVPPHPPSECPPNVGYISGGGDPYWGSNPMDYPLWGPIPMNSGVSLSPQYGGSSYAHQIGGCENPDYPGLGPGKGLVKLRSSSATKEARKKRMARLRRFYRTSSRHNNNRHNRRGSVISQQMANQHALVGDNTTTCGVYWPPLVPHMNHSSPMERSAIEPIGIEKEQGWETEKNLRCLLQKELKQSDVGNLGRIVLPKKEAETHLPELEARDGIPIAMEDIGTSRVWNMRYRFWANNKSRMYLLENTGDFVRSNRLQQGDFILIYSDIKCGKYV